MYLRDYLHDIPLKELKAIAQTLEVPFEYGARIKLINAIDRAFWDGTLTEKLLGEQTEINRRLISFLAFSFDSGVNEKALVQKMEKICGIDSNVVRTAIDELIPMALVGGIKQDDNLLFCPRGVAGQVRKTFSTELLSLSGSNEPVPSTSYPNLPEDIFSFLADAYKAGIPLTLMGKVKKTFLEKVFNGSITCTDPVLKISEDYRNTFVIDYLKNRNLIVFERRRVRATGKLNGWLQLTITERYQDIVSFALARTLQEDFSIIAFTGIIGETRAGSSITAEGLAHFLHDWTMAYGDYARLESRAEELLAILYHIGLLSHKNGHFIMTEFGDHFFNGKPIPMDNSMSGFFSIQPNFEVIAGPEIHPLIRFKLELLTNRKNRDMVLTYEVNQKGITRARERGMGTQEIIDFFVSHSRTPVPQNVRFSVEKWADSYGCIYFDRVTLMRFRDESHCKSVMHLPEVKPYVKEQLSDTVIVISRDRIKKLTEILKKAGYQPEIFGEPPTDTAYESEPFHHSQIDSLVAQESLPQTRSKFIFPEKPITDGDT